MSKKILFISANDFKNKSIQVIKITPVAYYKKGWGVKYIVARDEAITGNYAYEDVINPEGVSVIRIYWPFIRSRDSTKNKYVRNILGKISGLIVVCKLALQACKEFKVSNYDVVYGYEIHGILAAILLRFYINLKGIKKPLFISRFQGSFLNEMIDKKEYLRFLFNLDSVLAIKAYSDLIIMTDDGTNGDMAVKKLSKNKAMLFLKNGVDLPPVDKNIVANLKEKYKLYDKIVFLTVSRLVKWKRVERAINLFGKIHKVLNRDMVLIIVGEGVERENLEILSRNLGISNNVIFTGSVNHSEVANYFSVASFFLSFYDSSNVGNPLLEAVRSKKIIVTFNNGNTGSVIKHKLNGLIYDEDEGVSFDNVINDIVEIVNNNKFDLFIEELNKTENEYVFPWEKRMSIEIEKIEGMMNGC